MTYRSLLAYARYPGLLPPVHVHYGRGPAYKDLDYYDPESNTIYWFPGRPGERYGFLHEVGHAYDYQCLDDEKRARIMREFGWPGLPWFWPPEWNPLTHDVQPLCERFADKYAIAQMHRVRGWKLRRLLRSLNG